MSSIDVKFVKDNITETFRKNSELFNANLESNPNNNDWISNEFGQSLYVNKKYKISDFSLKNDEDYSKVRIENAITIYESIEKLPRYILSDERFWLWINIEKAYSQALSSMPISSGKNIFKNHWLFSHSQRRSIFFGVMSRDFFTIMITKDDTLEDKYEYSKYALENFNRVRNHAWRTYSSQKHIVLGILKAHKKLNEEFGHEVNVDTDVFNQQLAKRISLHGGINLLDAMTETEIFDLTYTIMFHMILES